MFVNTLGISHNAVRSASKLHDAVTGVVKNSMQGRKSGGHNKVTNERMKPVIKHIKSFRVIESHYVRHTETAQFLPSELSIREMHRYYVEDCQRMFTEPENYEFYRYVFNRRFNLKFHKPKKDQCNVCTSYNAQVTRSEDDEERQRSHIDDKVKTRQLKEELKEKARNNKEVIAAAFDLEQVLLAPHGQTGAYYYHRRLKNHNLTVTEIDNMKTYAFLWNEEQAGKGSCEVSTCVYKFLKAKEDEGAKVVYLFADRCGGQNSNRMMHVMLSNACNEFSFDEIHLIYLCTGHSYSENDTAHSVIEGYTRDRTLYTTPMWETAIQSSFKANKCIVSGIMHGDIIDYKSKECFPDYSDVLSNKKLTNSDGAKMKIKWSSIKHVKFVAMHPTKMFFKYKGDEFSSVAIKQEKREMRTSVNLEQVNRQLYASPIGIDKAKKSDLLKLCKKGLIPEQHHAWFENLKVNSQEAEDDTAMECNDKSRADEE